MSGDWTATCPPDLMRDFPRLSSFGVAFERLLVELKADHPTSRRGWSKATLSPGVVDDAAQEWFGYGNCPLLAQALHEMSGWPMRVVERAEAGSELETTWHHLGVLTPHDRFLDILGPREDDEVIQQYRTPGGAYRVRSITFEEGVEFGQFPVEGWRGHSTSVAVETICYFAHRLIQQAMEVGA